MQMNNFDEWQSKKPPIMNEEAKPNQNNPQAQMSDKDRINDLLATEKSLCSGYNIAINEAGTDLLYQLQLNLLIETHHAQRQLFHLMHQKGWYPLEQAPQEQIKQKTQQFTEYKSQFPYQ